MIRITFMRRSRVRPGQWLPPQAVQLPREGGAAVPAVRPAVAGVPHSEREVAEMNSDTTSVQLYRIRAAGLNRVRAAARRAGIETTDRDLRIIRQVAHGTVKQAAQLSGTNEKAVRRILARYCGFAEEILRRDAERAKTAGAEAPDERRIEYGKSETP